MAAKIERSDFTRAKSDCSDRLFQLPTRPKAIYMSKKAGIALRMDNTDSQSNKYHILPRHPTERPILYNSGQTKPNTARNRLINSL